MTTLSSTASSAEPPSLDAMLNSLVYILEAHKSHVRTRRDWTLLFSHCYLLASDFSFSGLQQQQQEQEQQTTGRSPILPAECWSDGGGQSEDIVLLYRRHGQQQQQQNQSPYVLCIVTMDADLIVSLAQQDTALNCTVPSRLVAPVDADAGADSIRRAYPEVEQLHTRFWEQIFRRLPPTSSQQQQQQQQQQQRQRPIPMPHSPQQQPPPQQTRPVLQPTPVGPFGYGRADLDPFGGGGFGGVGGVGGGGGMRFDPLRDQWRQQHPSSQLDQFGQPLPPGAAPPGARFDPYGPGAPPDQGQPGQGQGGFGYGQQPDPDNLRPPGWDDTPGGFGGGRGGGGFGGFGGGRGRGGGGGFGGFYM